MATLRPEIVTHQPRSVSGRVDFGGTTGELFSLGYGGILVRSSLRPLKGANLHFRLAVLGHRGYFEADGRVVGVDLDVLAIMFLRLSPGLLDLLQSLYADEPEEVARRDYDFSRFVASILDLGLIEMLQCVDEQFEEIAKAPHDNSTAQLRRQTYESELHRLGYFLRTGQIPEQTTPAEFLCYKQLATRLLAKGVVCQAFLELRDPAASRYAAQRQANTNRRAHDRRRMLGATYSAVYSGPERRRGSERRSGMNRRASQASNLGKRVVSGSDPRVPTQSKHNPII